MRQMFGVLMMWRVTLIFFSLFAVQAASNESELECRESYDILPSSDITPSFLMDLKAEQLTVGGIDMINISWAIHVDVSIKYLTGTLIVKGSTTYMCEYSPSLAKTDLTGIEQKWFHFLVKASYDSNLIQGANLPLPPSGSGPSYKYAEVKTPSTVIPQRPIQDPIVRITTVEIPISEPKTPFTGIMMAIFGGLVGLMILSSCVIFYKCCGTNLATSFGFKRLPTSPMVPVSVLMVYPAENLAFQQAVVALAEFLQWHGGCSVAIDMWQQGKIAELGLMRWLAEQTKAAERVLIVSPQPSSQPSHSPPGHSSPGPSTPAAAHDLYLLILNLVASHAKSATELAHFWVVKLGEQQDKRPSNLPLELSACKSFCLMKDLNKLCESLYTQRQDNKKKKTSDLIFRPGIADNEKYRVKLKETVEKLSRHQPSISREVGPLNL